MDELPAVAENTEVSPEVAEVVWKLLALAIEPTVVWNAETALLIFPIADSLA
nr:hypothetical protein [Ferriphaselus amnicola]